MGVGVPTSQMSESAIRQQWAAYVVACLVGCLAIVTRLLMDPVLHERLPFIIFFPAAVLVARTYGKRPALVTLLIATLGTVWFVLEPRGSAGISQSEYRIGLLIWVAMSVAGIELVARLDKAKRSVEQSLLRLREHQELLESEIAERRRAQAKTVEERERLKITLHSIGDGVIATDAMGQVTLLNPIAEQLTGWVQAEAAGQPLEKIFQIVNEDTRQPVDNPALRALREGRIVGLANHTLLIAKDGTERPIDDSAAPILGIDGAILGSILVFRDITDRKVTETEMKLAARRKNEFLATLAHELRNPLAPVRNAVELLSRTQFEQPEIEYATEVIERQLRQLARLLDDLMDVSRITRGKLSVQKEQVELQQVLATAIEQSEHLISRNGVEFHVDQPEQPVWLEADPTRLAQAFSNLLTNAAKFTPTGGRIHLTARRENGEVVVLVQDTGVGIPPDRLPQLFEMFSQASPPLERTQDGLGIGLNLVRGLVELHDGSVSAHSDGVGQGATFEVRLPILAERSPENPPSAEFPECLDAPPCRILVVDDNQDAANTMAILLRLQGHEVQTAYDGEQAVQTAQEFSPQVVLLDIGLPLLDGYEAARRIRRLPDGHRMFIVAMTGWGQEEDKKRAHEVGFDQHLTKPVNPRDLEVLIATQLQADEA